MAVAIRALFVRRRWLIVLDVSNRRVLYMVFNIGPVGTKVDRCFLETHTSFESPGVSFRDSVEGVFSGVSTDTASETGLLSSSIQTVRVP